MGAESSTLVESSSARAVAPATDAQAAADTVEIAWKEATHSAVSPRVTQGAAIADGAKAVVVCGHDLEAEYADAWLLDGEAGAWKAIDAAGRAPRARGGHTVIAVPGVGVVVFGGISHEKGGYLSDVAVLAPPADGGAAWAWTPVCATGELPCGRDKHSAIAVPDGSSGTMIVFGGFGVKPRDDDDDDDDDEEEEDGEGKGDEQDGEEGDDGAPRGPSVDMGWFDDAYRLDLSTFHWRKLDPSEAVAEAPAPLPTAAADCDSAGSAGVWGKLARKSAAAAAAAAPKAPSARAAHACCLLDGGMLLFGGRTPEGRANDTWVLDGVGGGDGARLRWRKPEAAGTPPSARSFHSITALPCTADGADRRAPTMAALFGGLDADGRHLADLHLFVRRPRRRLLVDPRAPGVGVRALAARLGVPHRPRRARRRARVGGTRRAPRRLRRLVGAGRDGRQLLPR